MDNREPRLPAHDVGDRDGPWPLRNGALEGFAGCRRLRSLRVRQKPVNA
jgi:hypothetical protein